MIEKIIAFGIAILIASPFIAYLLWRQGPRKCPKCGSIALGRQTMINTGDRDLIYRCTKCNHQWYKDYSDKII
jgi:transposase-like protein